MSDEKTRPVSLPGKKPAISGKKPALPPGRKPALPPGAAKKGPLPPGLSKKPRKPGLEEIKEESRALRGSLAEDLQKPTDHFDESGKQLLKFHGIYQQDDRDHRDGGKSYQFMVRARIPGGRLTAEQYLAHDELAGLYANDTLRITTRQTFQFHGVLKGDIKPVLQGLNEKLVTTLSACGDVVRNVVYTPAPHASPVLDGIHEVAQDLARELAPKTRAYHEVWLDGEKVYDGSAEGEAGEEEDPLYGQAYLPRKFKIGLTLPGDNSVDVYSQDIGLVAVVEKTADVETLVGFNVLVGGGLGMTHRKPETFPRLADLMAFVTPEEVVEVARAIVSVQRDHGDRENRRHARMKYLIHDWGLPRFQEEVEKRLGRALREPRPMPKLELELYLGWHPQGDGRYFFGLGVENGRIADAEGQALRTAIRQIVEEYRPGVRLTTHQDILFTDLREEAREGIEAILSAHGVAHPDAISNARKYSMACPAMPTCGLAIAESERVMPSVIDRLEAVLAELGLADEKMTVRMTGCPNGCARPYISDIGFVGRGLDKYMIFLGGRSDGSRLNREFKDLVDLDDLVPTLRPLFVLFKEERREGESFGDFCDRKGIEALQSHLETTPADAYAS